jgi:hypothetical protein
MNSSGIDLSPDSRCLVLSKYGALYTRGKFELAQFEVPERIRAAMRKDPTFCSMSTSLIVYSEDFIERASSLLNFPAHNHFMTAIILDPL